MCSTAASRSPRLAARASKATLARAVAKFTLTSVTPGRRDSVRSIRVAHDAQVIPSTARIADSHSAAGPVVGAAAVASAGRISVCLVVAGDVVAGARDRVGHRGGRDVRVVLDRYDLAGEVNRDMADTIQAREGVLDR